MEPLTIFLSIIWGFLFIGIIGCGYMLVRNDWVLKKQLGWSNTVSDYLKHLVRNHQNHVDHNLIYQCHQNTVSDFQYMMKKFWIWDFEKFILDQELYDMIINHKVPPKKE